MYKCDVCSTEINKEEMKLVSGPKVSTMSGLGFVPSQVGGPLAGFGSFSKEQIWATVVNQNPTSDWGFCHSCFSEFEAYEQKQQKEEARRREETNRREMERRAEEERRKPIIEQRKLKKQCCFCGRSLGLFDKVLKREHHRSCNERNASF